MVSITNIISLDEDEPLPEPVSQRWMTIIPGIIMIVMSIFGIAINLLALSKLVRKQHTMSSFDILCSSKTISNSIVLTCYLIYNGPATVLEWEYGPQMLNAVVNALVAYGIYFLGPLTQLCITANRFFAVMLSIPVQRRGGPNLTYGTLIICWCISIFIAIVGLPGNCVDLYSVHVLSWVAANPCLGYVSHSVMLLIIIMAFISIILNIVVGVKLAFFMNEIIGLRTSEARRRKKNMRKMFIQNCFQDLVYVVDTINSMYIYGLSRNVLYQFVFTTLSNLAVHVADGCIMFLFNYEKKSSYKTTPVAARNSQKNSTAKASSA